MAKRHSKRAAVMSVLLGTLLVDGVAFAAWTATGTGSGYAKATTAQALTTVDVSASTAATLYPGATGDAKLRIDNPNPYPVRVTDVAGSGAITSNAGAACNAATGGTVRQPVRTHAGRRGRQRGYLHADRLGGDGQLVRHDVPGRDLHGAVTLTGISNA